MTIRALLAVTFALLLAGCGDAPQASADAAMPAKPPQDVAKKARPAKVGCDVHYAQVRERILGILRGTEGGSLIAHATRNSVGVLGELEPGQSRLAFDCSFENRRFNEKRVAATGGAPAIPAECADLIERIDTRCLKPLAERGDALDKDCNLLLVSLADVGGNQRRLSNGAFCASMARDLR